MATDEMIAQLLRDSGGDPSVPPEYVGKRHPPASATFIESLNEFEASKRILKANADCPICLEPFAVGEIVTRLPCKHVYHLDDCLLPWLLEHNTCALCRYAVPTLDVEYEARMRFERSQSSTSHTSAQDTAVSSMFM